MQTIKRQRLGADGWREMLSRFVDSGLTTEAFCRREAVSTASFYRWRKLLGMAPAPDRALARRPPLDSSPSGFVDLGTLGERRERVELRLDLGGGLTLQLVRS